ncbi:MAG: polysaccharide deacetylase family protein [Catenulispora sp.]|nr:polysaccharide deacetylase family protein [Catenulispora sp.]
MTCGSAAVRSGVPLLAFVLVTGTGCGSSDAGSAPGHTTQAASSSSASSSASSPSVRPTSRPAPSTPVITSVPTTSHGPSPTAPRPPSSTSSASGSPSTTSTQIPARLAGVDWDRIPTTRPVVALTFDAGANADAVPSILATLHRYGVTATFFLTGDFVRHFPDVARQIAAGQRIGNHSVDHPYFTKLTGTQITAELTGARQQIQSTTGDDPRPLFRFPYGDRDTRTIAAVNAAGYVPVRWTVDTLGWEGTAGGITAQTVHDRALNALRPGEIVLMHCGSNPTDHSTLDADALGGVIQAIKDRGYGFVTLDALTR